MSGEVNKVSIASLQAQIQELKKQDTPEAKAKIQECLTRIGDILKGQTEPVKSGSIEITSEMGANFKVDPRVAEQPEIDRMSKYRDEAYIKEKFGDPNMTDAEFERIEKEYKEAKKELDDAQKANKKVKFSKYDDKAQWGVDKDAQYANVAAAQEKFQKAKEAYDRAKILHDVNDGDVNRGIKKAAKRNVENYTNVLNTQRVFMSKAEEEAAIAKDPSLDGKTKVLKDKDINTIMAIGKYADYKIKQAEASGDPAAVAAAKEKYGLYTEMFNRNEDGTINFSEGAINVRNAQNALVDESGFDQRFNLDEVKVMSDMYGVSKGDIRSTVKKFGFGTESGQGQKWAAAGAAAGAALAGNVINGLIGGTHSHQKASATSTAQGETVTGEVEWLASNGESFYHYYEAQGGAAAASVVAEACAKLPVAGQLLGPALAGVTTFLLTKPQTEDAFNGANVEAVLQDLNLVEGKDNKAIVLAIQDMEITGVKSKDDAIKAAVLKAALGENTKKANTEELLAAFDQLEQAKKVIGEFPEPVEATEDTTPPEQTTPPAPPEPPVEPDPCIRRTDDQEQEFTVKHRSGMGPWQYAEAIGVPKKYIKEFIKEFRADNNLDNKGIKYNKTPKFNDVYTFADGTTFDTPDKEETQRLIDAYKIPVTQGNGPGKWTAVTGKAIEIKNGIWVYCETGKPVPANVLKEHPDYQAYLTEHGHG